jgi:hypothetical protein
MYVYMHVHICVFIHMYLYIYIYIDGLSSINPTNITPLYSYDIFDMLITHLGMYMYMCINVYIYMCVYVCVYMCIYTHVFVYISILRAGYMDYLA